LLAATSVGFTFGRDRTFARTESPQRSVSESLPAPKGHFDIAVLGAGLVGLAVAREAAARGKRVIVLEREPYVAAGASCGNAGLGHTGYDAPEGSLERRLLRRAISLHPKLYRSFGLSLNHVRKCGSLVVAWTPDQVQALENVYDESLKAGDLDVQRLSKSDLKSFEPELSEAALGAILCPNEAVVEPFLIPIGYAESALRHGAQIHVNTTVATVSRQKDAWRIGIVETPTSSSMNRSKVGQQLAERDTQEESLCDLDKSVDGEVEARVVINCTGLYADELERVRLHDEVAPFRVTPRKGQYLVFETDLELDHVVETVPSQFSKGVIVWSTVYGNIIVGPTAEDQQSKVDRSTDEATMSRLQAWAAKVVPALDGAKIVGSYSGLRTATEFRDYQIKSFPADGWVTVAGIRSTGLTACGAIGEYVVDLFEKDFASDGCPSTVPRHERTSSEAATASAPTPAIADNSNNDKENDKDEKDTAFSKTCSRAEADLLGVSKAKKSLATPRFACQLEAVPTLQALSKEYQVRGDGCVTVYGKLWKVTHPIASFGMETYSGKQCGTTS